MIEVDAEVVALEDGRALVRTRPRSGGCGRCNEPGGCGAAKISSMFQKESVELWLPNDAGAQVGERVKVCVAEDASLNAALLGYLIPVLGIVLGAGTGVFLGGANASDGHALVGALAGLLAGVLLSRSLGRRSVATPEPVLQRSAVEQA